MPARPETPAVAEWMKFNDGTGAGRAVQTVSGIQDIPHGAAAERPCHGWKAQWGKHNGIATPQEAAEE